MQAIETLEKQRADLEEQKRELAKERTQLEVTLKLEESRLTARQRVLNDFATRMDETKESISKSESVRMSSATTPQTPPNRSGSFSLIIMIARTPV